MKTFGERLREARKDKKLTQSKLAAMVGMAPSSLGSLEHADHIPRGDNTLRIARALEVRAEWLLTGNGDKYVSQQDLSQEAAALLDCVLHLDPSQQSALLTLLDAARRWR